MALQRTVTLLPGVENHRAGRTVGDGGAERIVRTFHARFASIKCGGTTTARQAAEYVLREGKHAGEEDENKADVEASAGDKEAMLADARRIRQTARITRGPTGERILATQIIELPAESTKEQRQACAQAFVDDWRERGHRAIAVVHMHGHDKDRPQPHLHVLATGRPVAADGTVDRSAPLWRNRDEVKAERARTARLVNEHCHTVAAFHPGGFKDIGREEDTPKWRTPTGVYLKVVAAEAGGAGWEEKEEAGRAQYAAARRSAELAEPKRTRKKEIACQRERGEEPPRVRPTLRQRLALAEAGRSELAADLDRLAAERARLTGEKREAVELVGKAEVRVGEERARADRAEGRVRELQELNAAQTEYVTDWHGDRGVELPDLATVEGQSAAWANMRAWEDEARKKAEDEAAAKEAAVRALEDEQARTQGKIDTAVWLALETERERQEAEPDPAPPVPADLPVHEAQTAAVPDPAPQPDLPAAWTLPLGPLMKAGDAVAQAAEVKWSKEDSSPTSMPLDGIADSPVLTFTPARGLLRKQPASWRYEDAGRYAGKAAIELAQPGFTDRNLDWPNWRAAAEALSRTLVTDALEDGAEPPRWLAGDFPDLDEKYGPKIRTKEYYGEHARTYVGEMSGGEPHGAGTMTWTNGSRYEGAFENGHCHGQGGMTYADGERYEGAWQKSKPHGAGTMTWPNGGRYEGAWQKSGRHGQGVHDFPSGARYEGAWQKGVQTGHGIETYTNGSRYEGGWQKGKRHGPGIEITAEGQRTEGVWEDGKRAEAEPKKTKTTTPPSRDNSRGGGYGD